MDESRIAERVLGKIAGRGKEYQEYFDKLLKKWDVTSPADIPEDKKDDFFNEVDAGWKGKDEKKEASLVSLRDRRAE